MNIDEVLPAGEEQPRRITPGNAGVEQIWRTGEVREIGETGSGNNGENERRRSKRRMKKDRSAKGKESSG